MKKLIILMIVSVIFMANYIDAQNITVDVRDQPHFGVKAGLNLSNVYDEQGNEFNADAKLGYALGAFVSIPIGIFIGVQPELLYSQKGFKASTVILGHTYEFKRTLSYIDIPLLFAVKPVESLTLLAGPQYSFLTNQKDVFTDGSTGAEQEIAFENDNIRKNTLCFTGGLDINLTNLVIGARAGWDLQQNNGDGSSTTPRYKNVWYQATLGFRF
jgi:hypothetical protein